MKFNNRINNLYKIGKRLVDNERNFNKKYIKLYDGQKTISKDHYLLRHAFNILDYAKNENNEINPKEYLQEGRKEKYKFNIYNFEEALKPEKSKKLFSTDDELLKTLLLKIHRKNLEEQLKKSEEMKTLQSLSLKGIRRINTNFKKTFNTAKSVKSYNNLSGFSNNKSNDSSFINFNTSSKILKTKNISSYNNSSTKRFGKYEPPIKFYYYNLNDRLKSIFQNINTEEKYILTKSDFMKTNFKKTFNISKSNNSKTINTERIIKPKFIIKNPGKIKKKKDLENILFKDYDLAFNSVKNKIYTFYKSPKIQLRIKQA